MLNGAAAGDIAAGISGNGAAPAQPAASVAPLTTFYPLGSFWPFAQRTGSPMSLVVDSEVVPNVCLTECTRNSRSLECSPAQTVHEAEDCQRRRPGSISRRPCSCLRQSTSVRTAYDKWGVCSPQDDFAIDINFWQPYLEKRACVGQSTALSIR